MIIECPLKNSMVPGIPFMILRLNAHFNNQLLQAESVEKYLKWGIHYA